MTLGDGASAQTVLRPNHGLCTAVRKALLVRKVASEYLAQYGKHDSTASIGGSFALSDDEALALEVAMLFSVTGRQSEVGYRDDPGAYDAYKRASCAAFRTYATGKMSSTASKLPEAVIDRAYDALLNTFPSNAALKRVLERAHDLDLLRCTGAAHMSSKLAALQRDVGSAAMMRLASEAERAILVTGDRLLCSPTGGGCREEYHASDFPRCSQEPRTCLAAILSDTKPAPRTRAPTLVHGSSVLEAHGTDGVPSRFVGSSFKLLHTAQKAHWAATDWTKPHSRTAQRSFLLGDDSNESSKRESCLCVVLTEFAAQQPSLGSSNQRAIAGFQVRSPATSRHLP